MGIKKVSGLFLIMGILILEGIVLYSSYATGGIVRLLFSLGVVCILNSLFCIFYVMIGGDK